MADSQADRSEKPTPKRVKDAREKGKVARSRDLGAAASTLAATGALAMLGGMTLRRLGAFVASAIVRIGQAPTRDLGAAQVTSLVVDGGAQIALLVGPVALAAVTVGLATAIGQGGLTFAPSVLQFDWSRLSPANGLKRLSPSQSGVDTLKAALAASALGAIAWRVGKDLALDTGRLMFMVAPRAAEQGWLRMLRLLWQAGFALLALAAADYGVQRWRLMSSLKMTRQEVKDEARLSDGSPEIKARVRREQRAMTRRRMLSATKHATVVVTNPTHYAVALEYSRDKASAPVVVAKGRDLIAARIREIARDHGVPIVENPPLARALFAGAEVGDVIPAPLFSAVAEVLAYLVRIKQLVL